MSEQLLFSFPEWLAEIDEEIETKIHSIVKENSITAEQAKRLIEKKVKGGIFYKKNINFSKMIFDVKNSFAINVNQKRHFEIRKVERKTVPYDPDKFSEVGFEDELEELWENYYIDKFTPKELEWVRAGSAEVNSCGTCNSCGVIRCSQCKGNGEYYEKCYKCYGKGIIEHKCPSCNGRGRVKESQITYGGGQRIGTGAGYSSREVQCVRCSASGYINEKCSKCIGQGQILVTCKQCKGSGEITCTSCLGYRQLYTCDAITAKCKPTEQSFIVSNFKKAKSSWINSDKTVQAEYFEIAEELDLGEYAKSAPVKGRVLLEGYDLKIIPVSKVILNDGKKKKSIYLVGKDRKMYGGGFSYLDYTKIILFIILPIIVASTLLYFFITNN